MKIDFDVVATVAGAIALIALFVVPGLGPALAFLGAVAVVVSRQMLAHQAKAVERITKAEAEELQALIASQQEVADSLNERVAALEFNLNGND